jgi:ammonia channel protein AmtB
VLGICSGAVAGLVAITPASGFVEPGGALAIGVIAGASTNVDMSKGGWIDGHPEQILTQLIGIGSVIAFDVVVSVILLKGIDIRGAFRLVFGAQPRSSRFISTDASPSFFGGPLSPTMPNEIRRGSVGVITIAT